MDVNLSIGKLLSWSFLLISLSLKNFSGNALPFIPKRITLSWKYQDIFSNHFHTIPTLFKSYFANLKTGASKGSVSSSKGQAVSYSLEKGPWEWCSEPQIPKDPWGSSWNFPLLPSKVQTIGPWSQSISPHFFSRTQELETNSTLRTREFKTIFFLMWRNAGIQNVIAWPWTSVLTSQDFSTTTPWFPVWKGSLL